MIMEVKTISIVSSWIPSRVEGVVSVQTLARSRIRSRIKKSRHFNSKFDDKEKTLSQLAGNVAGGTHGRVNFLFYLGLQLCG